MKGFLSLRRAPVISILPLLLGLHCFSEAAPDDDLRGHFCGQRYPQQCCPGRDDTCTVPILGTVCYCDIFCNRTSGDDCCPDFWPVCLGVPKPTSKPNPPETIILSECSHEGKPYRINDTLKINCNKCTCVWEKFPYLGRFDCEQNVCLMRPDLINDINNANLGWQAESYPFFWGKTLEEGIVHRLGTFKPIRPTMDMTEIHMITNGPLPQSFDSRERWKGLIQPIKDQGDCAASWAFSTTALASDRLAIESLGTERFDLSPQQLLSCQNRGQRACEGGHLDKAWYYLRKTGVTTESCFPYASGQNGKKIACPFKMLNGIVNKKVHCPNGAQGMLYHSTPPYRVGPKEEEIMREIYYNGPVQATFRVNEDFFSYKSGVYRHSKISNSLPDAFRQQGWHSVRILGWGTDNVNGRLVKYWTCANSWGPHWGENGYFRVLRGENECDIEMFAVGVWANMDEHMV